ncbi:unnamed protein product [Malus baccata var. baccata]
MFLMITLVNRTHYMFVESHGDPQAYCFLYAIYLQAQDNIMNLPLLNGWGEAAAYYYHGLILDKGNTEKFHGMAVAALQAADEYFKEMLFLYTLCRNPPLWGTMKYLSEKIPKDASSKVRIKRDLYSHEKIMETTPTLPNFALALKPKKFQLPPVDPSWNMEHMNKGSNQLRNDRI